MRTIDYWPEVWRRARQKTWAALMPHNFSEMVKKVGLALVGLGCAVLISRQYFTDALANIAIALATAAVAYGALLLWNGLVVVPKELWKEERRRKAIIDAQPPSATQHDLPPQDFVTLRAADNISFDCSLGKNFYVELSKNAILRKPQSPKEGVYRLYVVQGGEKAISLSVAGEYRWKFADFSNPTQEGDFTIYEINILKVGTTFRYSGYPIFQSEMAFNASR